MLTRKRRRDDAWEIRRVEEHIDQLKAKTWKLESYLRHKAVFPSDYLVDKDVWFNSVEILESKTKIGLSEPRDRYYSTVSIEGNATVRIPTTTIVIRALIGVNSHRLGSDLLPSMGDGESFLQEISIKETGAEIMSYSNIAGFDNYPYENINGFSPEYGYPLYEQMILDGPQSCNQHAWSLVSGMVGASFLLRFLVFAAFASYPHRGFIEQQTFHTLCRCHAGAEPGYYLPAWYGEREYIRYTFFEEYWSHLKDQVTEALSPTLTQIGPRHRRRRQIVFLPNVLTQLIIHYLLVPLDFPAAKRRG